VVDCQTVENGVVEAKEFAIEPDGRDGRYCRQAVVVDRYGVIKATQSLVAPKGDVICARPRFVRSIRVPVPDACDGDRLRIPVGDDERTPTGRPVRLDEGPIAQPELVPVGLEVSDLAALTGGGDEFGSRLDLVTGAPRVGHGLRQLVRENQGRSVLLRKLAERFCA